MQIDGLKFWFEVFQFIFLCAVSFYVWATRRKEDDETEIQELKDRVSIIENEIKHMPEIDQVHDLRNQITEIKGDLRETNANIASLNHQLSTASQTLQLLNEYLMTKN